jgi:hypothetical protein
MQRQFREILEQIAPGQVRYHHRIGAGYAIEITDERPMQKLFLRQEPGEIILSCYPADTVGQARRFYTSVHTADFLALADSPGFDVKPYLKGGFVSTGICWSEPILRPDECLAFWMDHYDSIRQYRREEFLMLFDFLNRERILAPQDRGTFEQHFSGTQRSRLNLCPGWEVSFHWPEANFSRLCRDNRSRLISEIRSRMAQAMATWGQHEPFAY